MKILLTTEFFISTNNSPLAALPYVQCEILKQYLIGTTYGTEFLGGGESVQVNMPVYSQFLENENILAAVKMLWFNDGYLLITVKCCMKLASCHILHINGCLER